MILIIPFLVCSYVYWEDINFSKSDSLGYVPWEVIVKYKDSNQIKSRSAKWNNLSLFSDDLQSKGLEVKESFDNLDNLSLVVIKDDKSVEDVVEMLNKDPNVEYAEPNYIRYLFSNWNYSTEPKFNKQRSLTYIDWDDAYDVYSWILKSADPVLVWVIDNWVNYNHPDLSSSMRSPANWKCKMKKNNSVEEVECFHWYDFLHSTSTPLPNYSSHGTHVAWIIAAGINWTWIVWVNPHAKIAALKVWNSETLTISAEIQAIDFAISNNIKIINASYWARSSWDAERQALERYEAFWWLFVTAAWNNYLKDIDEDSYYATYPCMYGLDNIICVASVGSDWNISYFSNYWWNSVDIAAPWSSIISTSIEDSTLTKIYSNNFDYIKDQYWTGESYFYWWNWDYAYRFTGNLTSPSGIINLEDKNKVYIDFSIACLSYGVNVDITYSTWNWFGGWITIPWVYNMWYSYTIPVWEDYYANNFMINFRTKDGVSCIIDDLSVYEDPYYESNAERYTYMDWTSMATPHVAWLASLVWMINPNLTNLQVKNLIMQNGSDLDSLTWKTVSWKVINVKKTLDAAVERNIPDVEWLQSSWTGTISWNAVDWISKYYFEVFSWENVIRTWFVENNTSTWLNLTWDYTWKVQWLDEFWNKSDFSTGYICSKPVLVEGNLVWSFSWYECSTLIWNLNYQDKCLDYYEIVWSDWTWKVVFNWVWNMDKEVYIRNWFWEKTNHLIWHYIWSDSLPTINKSSYTYSSTTSTSQRNLWNVVSVLWVKDWVCGENSISIVSVSCSEWQWTFSSKNLLVTAPSNKQWNANCTIIFKDDEWNQVSWNISYSFNTVQTQTNNWWGWWGGGGWWWGWWNDSYSCKNLPDNAVANNKSTPESNTNYSYSTDTSKVCTFQCKSGYVRNEKNDTCDKVDENKKDDTWETEELVLEKPVNLELFDDKHNTSGNTFDFSWYNNSNPSSILLNWYTVEFNNAYEFAHRAWITTIDSIEKANMNWNLTRIAMAKMLSNYAINVLWKVPSNSVVPNFPDVSSKMNEDYWWAVTLSYQLWIMWKWINKFRPNDIVSRAEFGTALSRMLYWTQDWSWKYYSTHLDKLYKEWVISNQNRDLKELRWYVMIMLMRSAKN